MLAGDGKAASSGTFYGHVPSAMSADLDLSLVDDTVLVLMIFQGLKQCCGCDRRLVATSLFAQILGARH